MAIDITDRIKRLRPDEHVQVVSIASSMGTLVDFALLEQTVENENNLFFTHHMLQSPVVLGDFMLARMRNRLTVQQLLRPAVFASYGVKYKGQGSTHWQLKGWPYLTGDGAWLLRRVFQSGIGAQFR